MKNDFDELKSKVSIYHKFTDQYLSLTKYVMDRENEIYKICKEHNQKLDISKLLEEMNNTFHNCNFRSILKEYLPKIALICAGKKKLILGVSYTIKKGKLFRYRGRNSDISFDGSLVGELLRSYFEENGLNKISEKMFAFTNNIKLIKTLEDKMFKYITEKITENITEYLFNQDVEKCFYKMDEEYKGGITELSIKELTTITVDYTNIINYNVKGIFIDEGIFITSKGDKLLCNMFNPKLKKIIEIRKEIEDIYNKSIEMFAKEISLINL